MSFFTSRRSFLQKTVNASAAAALTPALSAGRAISSVAARASAQVKPFELEEITVAELQEGMQSGRFTSHSLVEKYTERIEAIDKVGPAINAIIEMNPDASAI